MIRPRDYPDDVPLVLRPAEGSRDFFWPLDTTQLSEVRRRHVEADRARMMAMGAREITLDMALMEAKGLAGSPAHRRAEECRNACAAIEARKGQGTMPGLIDLRTAPG